MKYKGIYFNLFSLFLKKPMIKKFGKDKTKESLQKGRILYRKMLEKNGRYRREKPHGSQYLFRLCFSGSMQSR